MGNPLVRFCEGQESNCDKEEILWHCRESRQKQRKQTSSYSHGRLLSTRKMQILKGDFRMIGGEPNFLKVVDWHFH